MKKVLVIFCTTFLLGVMGVNAEKPQEKQTAQEAEYTYKPMYDPIIGP